MPDDDSRKLSDVAKENRERKTEGSDDARKEASDSVDDVRVNVRVDPDLHERFKNRAEREGRPISWIIRRFMEHYADGGDVPPPPK